MPFIASYIHQIYSSVSYSVRASCLRMICALELKSPESICEKYDFDLLVAASIDQKPPDPPTKVDEEKVACFRVILTLLKLRHHLPVSILRALISLYTTPKHCMKPVIMACLCEAVLVCPNLPVVPELTNLFVDAMMESENRELIGFMGHVFETQSPIVQQPHFISRLLGPLTSFGAEPANMDIVCRSIVLLLRTWPGFLFLGFQLGAIRDLLTALMHRPKAVVNILDQLLLLDARFPTVTDSYCGFLLYTLLKNGFLEKMDQLAKKESEMSKYVTRILPYSTHYDAKLDISAHASAPAEFNIRNDNSMNVILKVAQSLVSKDLPNSITEYSLPAEENQWDWKTIQSFLVVVLPHNDTDAQSAPAMNFYRRLLDYFTANYLTESSMNLSLITDCLFKLCDLLCSREWGMGVLVACKDFSATLVMAFRSCASQENEGRVTVWSLTKCLLNIMTTDVGIRVIVQWGMFAEVEKAVITFTNVDAVSKVIKAMRFYPCLQFVHILYLRFLNSSVPNIAENALFELREKARTTPDFCINGFESILLAYIKTLVKDPSRQSQLASALNILCELLLNGKCLAVAAGDNELIQILATQSHHVFCTMLCRKDVIAKVNIQAEIEWWMKTGIKEYLTIYDKAVEMAFSRQISSPYPSIVCDNDHVKLPPHLFGQLVKTEEGIKALLPHVNTLIKMLQSGDVDDIRAALIALGYFGSVKATSEYLRQAKIVEQMINCGLDVCSYVVKGTLLASLSLIAVNPYVSETLQKNGFQFFKFGNHMCVIPLDPASLMIPLAMKKLVAPTLTSQPPPYGQLAAQLLNPIHQNQAKKELYAASKEKPDEINTPENAHYVMKLLANYCYTGEARQFLFSLFRLAPLVRPQMTPVHPHCAADAAARAFEAQILAQNALEAAMHSWSTIPIPHLPLEEIQTKKKASPVPEVYLSDADFVRWLKIDRQRFYSLTEQQQNEFRHALLRGTDRRDSTA